MATLNPDNPTSRKVARDENFDNTSHQVGLQTPIVDTSLAPSGTNVNARNVHPKGKLATDRTDCCLYLSDGKQWNFVGGCAGANSCRIGLNGTIAGIADGGLIDWDLIESDPAGMYSTTTNLFTVPQTGVYEIVGTLCTTTFSAPPLTFAGIEMRFNGVGALKAVQPIATAGDFNTSVIHKQASFIAGDTIDFRLNIISGTATLLGGVDATKGTAAASWVSIRRIE